MHAESGERQDGSRSIEKESGAKESECSNAPKPGVQGGGAFGMLSGIVHGVGTGLPSLPRQAGVSWPVFTSTASADIGGHGASERQGFFSGLTSGAQGLVSGVQDLKMEAPNVRMLNSFANWQVPPLLQAQPDAEEAQRLVQGKTGQCANKVAGVDPEQVGAKAAAGTLAPAKMPASNMHLQSRRPYAQVDLKGGKLEGLV